MMRMACSLLPVIGLFPAVFGAQSYFPDDPTDPKSAYYSPQANSLSHVKYRVQLLKPMEDEAEEHAQDAAADYALLSECTLQGRERQFLRGELTLGGLVAELAKKQPAVEPFIGMAVCDDASLQATHVVRVPVTGVSWRFLTYTNRPYVVVGFGSALRSFVDECCAKRLHLSKEAFRAWAQEQLQSQPLLLLHFSQLARA